MEFNPTIKQYITLMKLWAIPMEKVVDGQRVSILDDDWNPKYDMHTQYVGYWGAAWGGKSRLICEWIVMMCEKYPGTRWFLARDELKRLKQSTLLTMFEVLKDRWYTSDNKGDHTYHYYDIKGWIEFDNGSVIDLIELGWQPSDPNYARVGSTEYTWGCIDEASEVEYEWFDIIKSRVRYKLENFCHHCAGEITRDNLIWTEMYDNPDFGTDPEVTYTEDMRQFERNVYVCPHCWKKTNGLTGRVLCCFNPDKTWIYNFFYRRFKDKTLPSNCAFIPALPKDNPYLSKAYIQWLYSMSEVHKQRLLYWNFEYDDTPGRLFSYDKLLERFERPTVAEEIEEEIKDNPMLGEMIKQKWYLPEYWYHYRLVVDPAREWKDLAVIWVFNHKSMEEAWIYGKSTQDDLEMKCRELMYKYGIWPRDVLVDEGWVWGWLKDRLRCRGFIAHASAIQPKPTKKRKNQLDDTVTYYRLRDQCYHILSQNVDKIAISLKNIHIVNSQLTVEQLKRRIIEDTDCIVQINIDQDAPYRVISKQEVKKKIGRSPDLWDTIMMLMLFEIKKPKKVFARW